MLCIWGLGNRIVGLVFHTIAACLCFNFMEDCSFNVTYCGIGIAIFSPYSTQLGSTNRRRMQAQFWDCAVFPLRKPGNVPPALFHDELNPSFILSSLEAEVRECPLLLFSISVYVLASACTCVLCTPTTVMSPSSHINAP